MGRCRNIHISILVLLLGALFFCPGRAWALTEAGTQITNLATARYNDHTGALRTSESQSVVVIVAQVSDLTLTSSTCREVSPAGTVYIQHTLTNTGNGPDTFSLAVENIAGGNYLFSRLVLFSDALDGNGVPDDGTPISTTTLLLPGERFQFIVALSAPVTATNGQTAEALVSGVSQFDAGVTATNTDCATVTADAIVTATKALAGSREGLSPSGPYTYTISYTNNSNATATNVTFTDNLPPGMTYLPDSGAWSAMAGTVLTDAADGAQGTAPNTIDYSVSGNTIQAIIAEIGPNRSGTISFQATVDAGLLAPQNLDNTASFEYDDSATTHAGPFNTNTVTFSVLQVAGVTLLSPPSAPPIFQGQTVAFENVVTNLGNGVDTFDIEVVSNDFPPGTNFRLYTSGGGVPLLSTDDDAIPDTGPLQPGESYTVVLVAILPPGAEGGSFSVSKTATSSVDETVFATATDTLAGIIPNTVDVTDVCAISDTDQVATGVGPGPETDPVAINHTDPGATTTFSLFIENTSPVGAPADSYEVTCSASPTQFSPPVPLPTGWTVVIKNTLDTIVTGTGLVPQGDFEELLVEVTVPPDYPPGEVELYCQVLSPTTGAVDVRHDQVIVNTVRGLAMTPNNTGQLFPGESIVYKHTITNNGNIPETDIALSVANDQPGWVSAIFEDTNGNGILDGSDPVAASPFSLAVNESKTFLVQVFSPLNAALGTNDVSTLTATPTLTVKGEIHYPLVVTDNTAVMAGSLGISKEQALDANCDGVADTGFSAADIQIGSIPGACVLYKITATNTGTEKLINLLINDATPPYTVYYISLPMPPASSTVGRVSLTPPASQNGEIIADVGTLLPNQSAVLTFGVQIAAGTPAGSASVDNQTSATYTDFKFEDRTATSNTVILVVDQAAGVTLLADTTKTGTAGSVAYFAHTLINTGNGTDTFSLVNANVSGDDYDFSALSVYPDANGDGVPDLYTPLTDTGLLNAGGIFRFVIVGTVSGSANPPQIGEMTVTATSQFDGGVAASNTDRVVLSDGAIIEVYKAISAISGPSPSGRYIYTLSYFNKSALPATQVKLTDVIPAGMTYIAGSARWSVTGLLPTDPPLTEAVDGPQGPGGAAPTILYDFNAASTVSGTITAVIDQIGPLQSGLITFEVTVNAGLSPQTLNNVVSYTYDDSGAVPFNSNTVGFTVTQAPEMTIVGETIEGAPQGSTVSFHNLVTNHGNGVDTFDILVGVYDNDGDLIFPPLPEAPFPAGTTFQLYQSDGITPLSDTNANTMLDTGPLLPGASYTVVLQVTLPPTAVGGPFGVVKAVKSALTAMTVSAPDILNRITLNEVDLTNNDTLAANSSAPGAGPGPEENPVLTNSVPPPGTATFTLVVNNTSPAGTLPETFELEASSNSAFSVLTLPPGMTVLFKNGSGQTITQTASLAPGESEVVQAEVSVLITMPFGTNDIYFRARSETSGASDRKHDAVFVEAVRNLTLTPDNVGQVYPDNFVVYSHTLTNNGNIPETDIALSVVNVDEQGQPRSGWVSEIYLDSDPDGPGPALPNGTLGPEDAQVTAIPLLPITTSVTLLVKVIAPPEPEATQGMIDRSILTADPVDEIQTITHLPVSVTDTSTVIVSRIVLTKTQALDANCDGAPDGGVYASDPIQVLPGGCIRYKIVAESTGNTDAVNVFINEATPLNTVYHDAVPAGVSVGSVTTVPNAGAAGAIVAALGTMVPGATAEMTFGVLVTTAAPANSNIDNDAAAAHTDSSNLARAATSGTVSAQVLQVAGLLLSADGALDASPGGVVYFPHTLTNTGNGDDSFVLAAANLPGDGFDFDTFVFHPDLNGNGILDGNEGTTQITDTGPLAAGGVFQFFVAATVPLSALSGEIATLTVTATSTFDTAESASNTDTATVVRAVVGLNKASQTAVTGPSPSGPYIYSLSYTNTGNGPAKMLKLTDTIPAGMTYVAGSGRWSVTGATVLTDAADGPQGTAPDTIDYSVSGGTITAIVSEVAAGGSGTIEFSVNVDAGLPAQQVIGNTASYEYDDSPTSHVAPADSNTVDFTVLQAAGVTLSGDTEASVPQGGTLTFENVLTNTGNGPDTFEISLIASGLPDGTILTLDGVSLGSLTDTVSVGPVPAGGSQTVPLQVTLPTGTASGSFTIAKTATSGFDPTVSDSGTDTLDAIVPNTVDLTNDAPVSDPAAPGQGNGPEGTAVTTRTVVAGETASFDLFVNNTSPSGHLPDTYQFEASGNSTVTTPIPAGWGVTFDPSLAGPVSAGGNLGVVATVTVPEGFAPGTYDLFFRAVSPAFGDLDVKHDAVVVLAATRGLTLVSNDSDTIFAGQDAVYSHTLTNNGNVAETDMVLGTSDVLAGWSSTLYIDGNTNGIPDASEEVTGTLNLAPGQSVILLVVVTAPAGAAQNDQDVTVLTATPQASIVGVSLAPVSVNDTSTVVAGLLTLTKEQALDADCDGTPDGAFGTQALTTGVVPGACIRYRITAASVGSADVQDLSISDVIPASTAYTAGAAPAATTVGILSAPSDGGTGTVSVTIATLAPGDSAVVTFGVQVVAGAQAGAVGTNQATADYRDGSGSRPTVTAQVAATIQQVGGATLTADGTTLAAPGQEVFFSHTLTNTGNGSVLFTLTGANLSGDIFDLGGLGIFADADQNGQPDDTTPVTSVTLAGGGVFHFVMGGTVPGTALNGQTGQIQVMVTNSFDSTVQSNTDTVTVTANAVVVVIKTVSTTSGHSPGGPHTYTIGYENPSNATATAVTLNDAVPAGMTYVAGSGSWNVGATTTALTDATDGPQGAAPDTIDYSVTGNTITAIISQIEPGESGTVTFQARVDSGLSPQTISNTVSYGYFDAQASVGPFSDSVDFTVLQNGGVTLSGEIEASAPQGGVVTFENTLTNTGNATDTFDITFNAGSFPSGTVVKLYHPGGVSELADTNGNGTADTGPIAAGDTHTVVLTATLPAGATGGSFTLSKTATSGFDPTLSATAEDTLTEIAVRNLTLTTAPSQQVAAGGSVVYTHVLTNHGNVTEGNIALTTDDDQSGWTSDIYLDDGDGLFDGGNTIGGDTIVSTLTLNAGASQTLFVQVTAASTAAPPTQNRTTLTATPEATNAGGALGPIAVVDVTVVIASDLTLAKTQALDANCDGSPDGSFGTADIGPLPGACIRYQITLTNSGTAAATDVQVQDGTPSHTTYHSVVPAATVPQGTVVTPAGGSSGPIDVAVGPLGAGQSVTITFGVQVQAGTLAGEKVVNDAEVTFVEASGLVRSLTSGPVTAIVAQTYGVSLAQNGMQSANPGQTVFFPHTLTNLGNGTDTFGLTNVNVQDPSDPDDFDFIDLVLYADPNCNGILDSSESTTPITSTGPLAAGAEFCLIASAEVPGTAQEDDIGDMRVTAVSRGDGTKTDENQDSVTVTVDAVINLTKTVSTGFGISPSGPYTYTITYSNPSNATATMLEVKDTIPAGMTYVAGSGRWSVTGATSLTDVTGDLQGTTPDTIDYSVSGGTITAIVSQIESGESGTVTFQVNVNSGVSPGNIQNTASATYNNGAGVVPASDAVADFTVLAQPTVSKAFGTDSMVSGGLTTLTITIGNPNTGAIVTSGPFTDTLPLGMVVGSGTSGSCGNVTAGLGGNTVTMASGTTIPFGGCTIVVDVTATAAGDYVNTISAGALNTTTAGSNPIPATDTLTVFAPPTVSKAFSPTTIRPGEVSTLTITLGNPNGTTLTTSGTFTDTLPDGMTLASGNTGTCTSGVTATVGAGSVGLASGTVLPAGGCTIVVDVTATAAGDYGNTIPAGALNTTTAGSNALSTEDTLTVSTFLPPTVTKSFGADSILSGGQTTLTITIGNGNTTPLTVSGNTVDNLQSSMVLTSGNSGTCPGIVAASGDRQITIPSGMTIPAGGCTIVVGVTATLSGDYVNTILAGALSTTTAGSNPSDATDTLTVTPADLAPPTMTKAFDRSDVSDVAVGVTSTLRITINNPNLVPITGMALTDLYPTGGHPIGGTVTGMINAASPSVNNTCGGTVTATARDNEMSLSDGELGAGAECVIEIQVLACPVGRYINTTSVLTSSAPDVLEATATLKVGCPAGGPYLGRTGATGPGDLNCDGIVNIDDVTIVTDNFGKTSAGSEWVPAADPDCNQLVNVDDLTIVTSSFANTY